VLASIATVAAATVVVVVVAAAAAAAAASVVFTAIVAISAAVVVIASLSSLPSHRYQRQHHRPCHCCLRLTPPLHPLPPPSPQTEFTPLLMPLKG